jgi:hypothetical protein
LTEAYEGRSVEIEVDGKKYAGTYRVLSGSVIGYYKDQIRYAQLGMDRPDLVARWLLTDVLRKLEWRSRERTRGPGS